MRWLITEMTEYSAGDCDRFTFPGSAVMPESGLSCTLEL